MTKLPTLRADARMEGENESIDKISTTLAS